MRFTLSGKHILAAVTIFSVFVIAGCSWNHFRNSGSATTQASKVPTKSDIEYLANSILDRFQSEEEITTAFGENGFSVRKRSKFELWAFKKVQGKFPTSYVYDVFLLIDSSGQFQVREVRVTGHGP